MSAGQAVAQFPAVYPLRLAQKPAPRADAFATEQQEREDRLKSEGFVQRVLRDGQTNHRYVVYLPPGYTPHRKWPVLLYLHGASERGTDGLRPLNNGLAPMIRARPNGIPFIAIFPQSTDRSSRILQGWAAESEHADRALAILDDVSRDYAVDPERVILTGWSMGGHGVWSLAAKHPDRFAALVPVAAGGEPEVAARVKDLPVWAFHGRLDRAVPAVTGRKMVEAHQAAGGSSRFTEVRSEGHAVWRYAYGTDAVLRWMQNPRSMAVNQVTLPESERVPLEPVVDSIFRPAVEIPGAVTLHLGQRALRAASLAIPGMIPEKYLHGELDSVSEFTQIEKRAVSLRFAEITWAGSLSRVVIRPAAGNRITVQLAIQDTHVRIGTAFVAGGGQTATAGPIDISIGERKPVWITVVVEPAVEQRRLKFRVIDTQLALTPQNFTISPPQRVAVQGGLITQQQVSSALVRGLEQRRDQFSARIRESMPAIVERMEQQLEIPRLTNAARTIWPIPVYQPLLRSWPEEILADEKGITIVCGLTAASLDPDRGPATPKLLERLAPPAEQLPRGDDLEIGLAPGVLAPMSQLLLDAGISRIHVGDIPGQPLREFLDKEALGEAIPWLKTQPAETELWAELQLTGVPAMSVAGLDRKQAADAPRDGDAADEEPQLAMLRARAPGLSIHTQYRRPGEKEWSPLGTFGFRVARNVDASVLRPGFSSRQLKLEWNGPLEVNAVAEMAGNAGADGVQIDRLSEMFRTGIQRWAGTTPFVSLAVPAVDFGDSRQALAGISWTDPLILLRFESPGIKIVNRSRNVLKYETRRPVSSQWDGPYELKPREFHEFPVGSPLVYRQVGVPVAAEWTLGAGTMYEYRSYGNSPPGLYQVPEPTVVSGPAEEEAPPSSQRNAEE
ncbi:MAG: prolyl oligopeptidase family serine peptidase [Planctomycetaceae bacterium]|nr:prolyl oligopeptidase family serine peptidase [Planctomycetaceae bacterium]